MTELWAVHVEGPDEDVIAAASFDEAADIAGQMNAAYELFTQRPDASEADAKWHAVVIPWDGTPQEHAEEMARPDRLDL